MLALGKYPIPPDLSPGGADYALRLGRQFASFASTYRKELAYVRGERQHRTPEQAAISLHMWFWHLSRNLQRGVDNDLDYIEQTAAILSSAGVSFLRRDPELYELIRRIVLHNLEVRIADVENRTLCFSSVARAMSRVFKLCQGDFELQSRVAAVLMRTVHVVGLCRPIIDADVPGKKVIYCWGHSHWQPYFADLLADYGSHDLDWRDTLFFDEAHCGHCCVARALQAHKHNVYCRFKPLVNKHPEFRDLCKIVVDFLP
jgi:hypothetical protein